MRLRALHVVKTADGARWAAQQAKILSERGVEIHVVVPVRFGEAIPLWQAARATIHIADFSLPIGRPHRIPQRLGEVRALVGKIQPDVIHSHFVTTTMLLRLALGRRHPTPRVFQVPGPLHLEHAFYRWAEIALAGEEDYWIASSRYTYGLYKRAGIPLPKLFLSYYGFDTNSPVRAGNHSIRKEYGLSPKDNIVGNINYMYPPKYFLGQTAGLKRHEDVIDALALVCKRRSDVTGVLVGGQWGPGKRYERRLRDRAREKAGNRIVFLGHVSPQTALEAWHEFDCAVHVPISENCGGVIEPLVAEVPTIASNVGGLPEVVLDGVTGWLVPVGRPELLAKSIETLLDSPLEAARRAELGRVLVSHMFDVRRTGAEIFEIYRYLLGDSPRAPTRFDSSRFFEDHLRSTSPVSG